MKIQYLGDSKDSFKWDYHDYIANYLKFPTLKIILMMTPPDETGDGKTHASLFPASEGIIRFCRKLRLNRDYPQTINSLPTFTGSNYSVALHKPLEINKDNRISYFSILSSTSRQLIFIDPDNGFEPEKSFNEKHIRFNEVQKILHQLPEESVISIFQHFRYIKFTHDFARIKERLGNYHITAIYWYSVMFVAISSSKAAISCVKDANFNYVKKYPFINLKVIP